MLKEKLEKILSQEDLVCDAIPQIHHALIEEGFEFIGKHNFRKSGILDKSVERKIYSENSGYTVIVDAGIDYDEIEEGTYESYYYIDIGVINENLDFEFLSRWDFI